MKLENKRLQLKVVTFLASNVCVQVDHVLQERDLMRMVHHPSFVQLLASFQDESCLYLVMEYVPGGELFTIMKRQEGR